VAVAAVFWLVGLACLIAALAGKAVKVGTVEMPAFAARATRIGASGVGVLALFLGCVVYFGWGRPGGADTATVPISTVPRSNATGTAGTAPGDDLSVVWSGTMTVAEDSGVDVGRVPPAVQDIIGSSFYLFDGHVQGQVSAWTGPAAPTAADCANQLRTHPARELNPQTGLDFCTYGQSVSRVADVRITSYDVARSSMELDVVIWTMTFD
jgi:hypothetical protein